jgi:hypothetical protein
VEAGREETLGRERALEALHRTKKLKAAKMRLSILENCHDRMVNIADIVDYNSVEKSRTRWIRSARMYSSTGAPKEAGFHTWGLQAGSITGASNVRGTGAAETAGSSTS